MADTIKIDVEFTYDTRMSALDAMTDTTIAVAWNCFSQTNEITRSRCQPKIKKADQQTSPT
jgi:hypothetical protein